MTATIANHSEDLSELEKILDVVFKNKSFLQIALTHRSFLNENPDTKLPHNERLEFLGDAVLELAVTEHLYKTYDMPEGDLTNLRAAIVRGEMLSKIAQKWELDRFLRLSKGERKDTGKARQYILANAVEAVIGAVYMDRGYKISQELVMRDVVSFLPIVLEKGLHIDAKSHFQELAQERFRSTPTYKILEESGPDHAKEFRVGVFLGPEPWGEGLGTSKQEAEQQAARAALEKIGGKTAKTKKTSIVTK